TNYATGAGNPGPLEILFESEKRVSTPNLVFYNPLTGTSNNVEAYGFIRSSGSGNTSAQAAVTFSSNWTLHANGRRCASYQPNAALANLVSPTQSGTISAATAVVNYHFTVDARLGIV